MSVLKYNPSEYSINGQSGVKGMVNETQSEKQSLFRILKTHADDSHALSHVP